MPPPNKEETIARLGAEFDASEVIDGIRRMGTDWGKEMRRIEKKTEESMQGTGKAIKEAWWQVRGAKKAYKDLYATQTASLRNISRGYDDVLKQMSKTADEIKAIQESMESLEMAPADLDKMNRKLEMARESYTEMAKQAKIMADEREAAAEAVEEIKEKFTFRPEEIGEALKEAGGELWAPFGNLISGDLPGAIEKGGQLAGKGWETLFKKTGKVSKNFAKFLAGDDTWKGMRKVFKERWAGGGIGGKAKAIGGAAMGGLFKGMGEILGVVGKLGPLLMTVSTLVMGLVQMFLQADAAAKDFNKQITSTAGSAEFMASNFNLSASAAKDFHDTLGGIYKQATDLSNLEWGLSKEDYQATLNALTAEGVSLKKLEKEMASATGYAQDWSKTVQMSVAYARGFGVSLQEIGQFQGELMTELGANLDDVETSFQYMQRAALQSGIATNKFFGIIRGFSADMTLFNIRMEDIAKVMVHLGKAMSPRDAQKFMSNIMGFFKGQGLGDRAKHVLMGGGAAAVGGRRQKTVDEKIAKMAADIEQTTGNELTADDMKGILQMSDARRAKWMAENKSLTQDQIRAINDAAITQGKLTKGGLLEIASDMKDYTPIDVMEELEEETRRIASKQGKRIEDLTDIERLAAENAVGVTDEMQDQFRKLRMATEQTRANLIQAIEHGDELTEDQKDVLKRMGIDASKADAIQKLQGASTRKIWDAFGEDQQRELADAEKQIDYQKQTASNVTSVTDQIKILTDWFMRVFYQAFEGLVELVGDLADHFHIFDSADRQWQKTQLAVSKSGNQELINITQQAKNADEWQRAYHKTKAAKQMYDANMGAGAKIAKLRDRHNEILERMRAAKDGTEEKARLDTELKANDAQIQATSDNQKIVRQAISDGFKASGQGTTDVVTALQASGVTVSDSVKNNIEESLKQGRSLKETLDQLVTISDDQRAQAYEQVRIRLKPDALAKATADAVSQAAPDLAEFAKKGASDHTLSVRVTKMPSMDSTKGGGGGGAPAQIAAKMGAPDADDMEDQAETTNATLQDIYNALRFRGIVLDKAFLETSFHETIQKATYEAASEALGDYYVLTHTAQSEVLGAIQKGMDPKYLGREIGSSLKAGRGNVAGGTISDVLLQRNAAGGMVTAVRDGLAVVRPPAGEGIAAVGPGERIGGGGGSQVVEVVFRGDAGKVFDARVQSVIAKDNTARTRR